jgi:hypothetical protein
MLVSVHLEIVLILVQDKCTVCVDHTIRLKIVIGCTRWISKVTLVMWNLVCVHLEIVLVLIQDRCMVCSKHSIGLEIILDTPSVLLGYEVQLYACFSPFRDSANLDAR